MAVISSHCLNGVDGTHAGGIGVRLVLAGTDQVVAATQSDAGGRLSIEFNAMGAGQAYDLIFETAAYWQGQSLEVDHAIAEVVLRLDVPDPKARYHRPVILSPNGYSTWASKPE